MLTRSGDLSRFERSLTALRITKLRPGEGRGLVILFLHGFLILFAYQLIRPVREGLILTCSTPVGRSYAAGVQAALLLVIIPVYGMVFRQHGKSLLIQRVNIFFIANLVIFYLLGQTTLCLGVPFFIWVGIFNVMVVAQFWAFAADLYNVKSGQRLFAAIGVGTTSGALVGSLASRALIGPIGPYNLMLMSAAAIAATLVLSRLAERAIPEESRSLPARRQEPAAGAALGGFGVVFRDRYLMWIAAFVLLLNWITSNGEYILSVYVDQWADGVLATGPPELEKDTLTGEFYGGYYAWVNALTLLVQTFLVARLFELIKVRGSLPILPVLFLLGFLTIGLVPALAVIEFVLIAQRGFENSLMMTIRNALFLPTSREDKYEGKTTIETFFWRFGDLAHAGGIAVLIGVAGLGVAQVVSLTMVLSLLILVTALVIGRRYGTLASSAEFNLPPDLVIPLPDQEVAAGAPFAWVVADTTFRDQDPGDLLTLSAALQDGRPLPQWIRFEASRHRFHGVAPHVLVEEVVIRVTATDVDGAAVSDTFSVRHREWHSG